MTDFFKTYLPNVYLIPDEFVEATKQTLYMSFDSIHWRDDWNHLRCDVSSDTP